MTEPKPLLASPSLTPLLLRVSPPFHALSAHFESSPYSDAPTHKAELFSKEPTNFAQAETVASFSSPTLCTIHHGVFMGERALLQFLDMARVQRLRFALSPASSSVVRRKNDAAALLQTTQLMLGPPAADRGKQLRPLWLTVTPFINSGHHIAVPFHFPTAEPFALQRFSLRSLSFSLESNAFV